MPKGLNVVILDDDPQVCSLLEQMTRRFYTWGEVHPFTDYLEARTFCFNQESSIGIFVLDVFLGEYSAFDFIEAVSVHYPMAPQDSIVITGNASDDIVDTCVAVGVNHLLEKPIKRYAYQCAVRAIAAKYLGFAQRLMNDPAFAKEVEKLDNLFSDLEP